MNQHLPEREPKFLSEQLATRVLTRASELDAALRAGASVAELRRAALEAGISAEAFEAALAEVQDDLAQVPDVNAQPPQPPRLPQPRARRRTLILATVIVLILGMGYLRMRTPTVAAVPTVEAVFPLRCLASAQAAELVRPLMRLPQNTVVASPANAPGVLTVRGTPDQIRDVQALLNQYEGPSACAAAQPPARTP